MSDQGAPTGLTLPEGATSALVDSRAEITIYLDVDGVLSPVTKVQPDDWRPWENCTETSFHLLLSARLAEAILALGCTVKWLTTWEDRDMCNTVVGQWLGWEPMPVLARRRETRKLEWWKLTSILADLDGKPFIWIDDDLNYQRDEVMKALSAHGAHTFFLCSPDPYEAITAEQLHVIDRWIDLHVRAKPEKSELEVAGERKGSVLEPKTRRIDT